MAKRAARDEGDYLTVEQAYEYLGVSRGQLYILINSGQLKRYKRATERRVYFRKADLDKLRQLRATD